MASDPIDTDTDAIRDAYPPHNRREIVALCDVVDRLRERNLAYARDLAALRAERDAWKALAEGRASMLAFYRVGKQPSEAAWRKVDAARQALAALEATDG